MVPNRSPGFAEAILTASLAIACGSPWPGKPPSPEATALQARINVAIAAGTPSFEIPPGTYSFNSANLNVSDALGFALLADAVTLVFTPGFGVVVRGCTDVRVSGPATVDHSSPAYSQGTIVSIGSTCFSTAVPPDWPNHNQIGL